MPRLKIISRKMFSDWQRFAAYSFIETGLEECPTVGNCKNVCETLASIREGSLLTIGVGCQLSLRRPCAMDFY